MYLGGSGRVGTEAGMRTPATIKCYNNKWLDGADFVLPEGKMRIEKKTNGGKGRGGGG